MEKEIQTWLEDINRSIEEITYFLRETKNFFEFQKDLKTRKAVERNIEIIGEAVSRILKFDPEIKIGHARKIIDIRNRIIHGYDTVSEDIIWAIVTKDLGQLQKEIHSLLDS